jgi:hypothetical protein
MQKWILTISLLTWLFCQAAFAQQVEPENKTRPAKILIITTPGDDGYTMAKLLARLLKVDVEVTDSERYAPLIDEHYYDGFVYLGGGYNKPPKGGFLQDMRTTRKPVFWINYHAWLLGDKFFQSRGFTIKDEHYNDYTSLIEKEAIKLTPTDTTFIQARGNKVLYWLFAPKRGLVPAAVHTGNFTYLGYSPTIDTKAEDFELFHQALQINFNHQKLGRRNAEKTFAERIAEIRQDNYRTGVHLPIYVANSADGAVGYDSDLLHPNLIRIKNTGAEWINIVCIHYQDYVNSSRIYADPVKTPTLESLRGVVSDARKLGLHVRLTVVVNIAKPRKGQWRGMISPRSSRRWWKAYNSIALKLARFAKDNEVEALIIGAELNRMQKHTAKWRQLIRTIRTRVGYEGLLGYQVNFDAMTLKWARSLDFVGVAGYWPLSTKRDPKLTTLRRSWNRIHKKIRRWKRANPGVTFELGEIGYVAQPYASVYPYSWKPHKSQHQSLNEQLQCYKALYDYLARHNDINGVHFFASTNEDTDSKSIGYTPFGKPAQGVMEKTINLR